MDPDFESNRRQYLAEQESKKGRAGTTGGGKSFPISSKSDSGSRAATGREFPDTQPVASKPTPVAKGPDPDLIDFFDSIEQNQQRMAAQPQPGYQQHGLPPFNNNGSPYQIPTPQFQQNGFSAQQTGFQNPGQIQQQQQPFNNDFQGAQTSQQSQPLQTNFTSAVFGGYTPQPSFQPGGLQSIPQDSVASFQQQASQQPMQTGAQNTNPFRQSMMSPTSPPGPLFPASPPTTSQLTRQSTNPFAKPSPQPTQSISPPLGQESMRQQAASIQPMATGTNPFARGMTMPASSAPGSQTIGGLAPQPTGSTNPFRQSHFINTATGMGWQNNQKPLGGGLDNLETVPVFPRPAQQQPWQQ